MNSFFSSAIIEINLFVEIMYPAFSNIGERIKVHIDTAENLADVATVEKSPKVEGRSMTMFLTEKR